MLTLTEQVLFALAALGSATMAWRGFAAVFKTIARGTGPVPHLRWRRMLRAVGTWLSMAPIWKARKVTSAVHALVAWGFVFYLLVNVLDVVWAYTGVHVLGEGWLGGLYRLGADVFSGLVLVGMVALLVRRFLTPAKARLGFREDIRTIPSVQVKFLRLTVSRDSLLVGSFILLHVGFRLVGESFGVAEEGSDPYQPLASAIGTLWPDVGLEALRHLSWWLALGLILLFVPFFPYTKHFHFIMAGYNFWSKPARTSPGALDPIDFEDEAAETFGVQHLEDLPATSIVDAFACIMCNRCQDVCPAYETGKDLSPAALEVNKRYHLNEHLHTYARGESPEMALLDYAITESALWACTACGACVEVCPVGNEPMHDILNIRRGEVLMENRFPSEFQAAYRGMERNGNPWNLAASDRMGWADGLDVPTVEEEPEADILWWVGCAPAYDQRAQSTARSLVSLLRAAGVRFAVLGGKERCTGDAARRSGNEYLFDTMARANIETLNEVRPQRILTTCPHCLHTLGKEYGALGGHYEVIHHTELLAELSAEGRLDLEGSEDAEALTFHDPCYLGRQNGITKAPREALGAMALPIVEMPRNGKNSFCCGAGGAQMWKEEEPPTVNSVRYSEAEATGARTLATGCPFCLAMLTDASKSADQPMVVKDVAELLAERLPATREVAESGTPPSPE